MMNPLRKIPTFEAPDGWVLTEVIPIAIHCKLVAFRHLSTMNAVGMQIYYLAYISSRFAKQRDPSTWPDITGICSDLTMDVIRQYGSATQLG